MIELDPYLLYEIRSADLDPDQTYCITGQEIFEIGTHKGLPYDGRDNALIAANFDRFYRAKPQPLLQPPAVIGHEEDLEVLKRTDLPAAGWVTAVKAVGTKLFCDLEEMPALAAYWIKKGLIRTVSAEIYEDSGVAGLPAGFGPTLRRVALVGGDIPQVKTIARLKLPVPESRATTFTEGGRRVASCPVAPTILHFFTEGKKAMPTPKHSVKMFTDCGMKEDDAKKFSDMMNGCDPDQLKKMTASLAKMYAEPVAAPAPAAPAAPVFDRAAAIEFIASKHGIDRAALEAKTDDELKALMADADNASVAQHAEGGKEGDDPTPMKVGESQDGPKDKLAGANPKPGDGSGGGESEAIRQHSEKVTKLSEGVIATLDRRITAQERRAQIAALQAKTRKVNTFCEDAVKAGIVTPAELKAGLKDKLMREDDERVMKFTDGDTTHHETELDRHLRILKARPKLHIFTEKIADKDADDRIIAKRDKLLSMTDSGKEHLRKRAAAGK